ncbi:hemerythrin domain-containing protein [Paenibacillus sedimenti]|uniref:Hemerythrin domain-containing protein n=1 Tax=Paenibacillus sedimenti TaxID=2770274 RepID=A0A926KR97_9BACL|nr:hemerythrin domain-containing protein [Paenibacillus sedimenti]MBD0382609.1 hemerythrin domain-containing protein [Paenibacillus sedimenti]
MEYRLSIQSNREYAEWGIPFPAIVERWKEEHRQMRNQLADIRMTAVSLFSLEDCSIGMCRLIELQDRILSLIEELEQHSEWEEQELFPRLHTYLHPTTALSISRSITVLEQDHDLAKRVVQSYVDGVNGMKVPIDLEFLQLMTSELVTACLILLKHITLEEELVYPLTDQIVNNLA